MVSACDFLRWVISYVLTGHRTGQTDIPKGNVLSVRPPDALRGGHFAICPDMSGLSGLHSPLLSPTR